MAITSQYNMVLFRGMPTSTLIPGTRHAQYAFGSDSEEDTVAEPNLNLVIKKLNTVIKSQKFIAAEFEIMKACNSSPMEENAVLRFSLGEAVSTLKDHQLRISTLESDINDYQQHRLSNHMCIAGIPTTKDENLKQIISEIGIALNLEVSEGDVLQAHRMQSNTKEVPQTIQVAFTTSSMKQRYIEKRKTNGLL